MSTKGMGAGKDCHGNMKGKICQNNGREGVAWQGWYSGDNVMV